MTSQKSTSKNTICLLSLIREDQRHKTWMIALSILGSFLAGPVAALFFVSRMIERTNHNYKVVGTSVYNRYGDYIMTLAEYYQARLSDALGYLSRYYFLLMLAVALVGAVIVSLCGFRFLYHKRMVDLYHSMPVSRKKHFLSIWLSGFLIWFVPMFVCSLLVFPLLVIYLKGMFFATIFLHLLLNVLRLCLCFLIVYNACLVAVMISGNVLNAIVASLTYGLIVVMGVFAFQILEETFYFNDLIPYEYLYSHPLYVFSPFVTPLILTYTWASEEASMMFYEWHLCVGSLLALLNFVFSYVLYLKRPSELSERGIEFKPARIILRALISLIGGVGFTMIFYAISQHQFGWMLFGAFLGSALAFCVMNVICHGTFKEVFSHKLQYVLVLAGCILLFTCMIFDLTGYDKRLPKKENITGLSVHADFLDDDDWPYVLKNGKLVHQSTGSSLKDQFVFTDQDQIYALLSACVSNKRGGEERSVGVNVKVSTKWGSYYRRYHLPISDIGLLAPMVATKEYQECYYPLKSKSFGLPEKIGMSSSFSRDETILEKDRIEQLMNAFHQDFEEHNGVTDLLRDSRVFTLHFTYPLESYYVTFSRNVPYWYEHTIELIESWYPKKVWDPTLAEVTSISLDGFVPLEGKNNVREAVYQYLGFDGQGKPLSSPPVNPEVYAYNTDYYASWDYVLTDVDLLKEIEPYMIWGYYSDTLTTEYALLGCAYLEDGGTVDCYVRYGKLPSSILEEIISRIKIQDFSKEAIYEEDYYEETIY